jgi:hypothetical protein
MRRPNVLAAVSLLLVVGITPIPTAAQDGYFFRPPQVTLAFRVGGSVPIANSDIHRFFTDELTINRRDFASVAFGADLGFRVLPQFDVVLTGSYAQSSTPSEFRDWTDLDDLPIEQVTELKTVPVTASLKYYLSSRGRSLSRFAWVPRSVVPYVGVGGGVMWYDLDQEGDFVDFQTLEVFPAHLHSDGATPMLQLLAGGDWWIGSRFGLNLDARYSWADARLGIDFEDFGKINLSGFQLLTGLTVRF